MEEDEEGSEIKSRHRSGSSQSSSYYSAKMSLQRGSQQTLYKSILDIPEIINGNKQPKLIGNGLSSQGTGPELYTTEMNEIMPENNENCDVNGQDWELVKILD